MSGNGPVRRIFENIGARYTKLVSIKMARERSKFLMKLIVAISRSHGDDYKDGCLLGCNTVFRRRLSTF